MAADSAEKNAKLLAAYQMVGLDEDFSRAIVEGGNAKYIVETWKASWRGDNTAEHPAIRAVLSGNATPEEAKSLLEAAKNHRDLVDAVASGSKSMKWAHTVLTAGFNGKKEAVSALLEGADPSIIAHVLDIALTDADAKLIRRGSGARRNKSVNEDKPIGLNAINKYSKSECVSILSKFSVPFSGSTIQVRQRLSRFLKLLRPISKGLLQNSFEYSELQLAETKYSYHDATNIPGTRRYVRRVNLSGPVNLKNLKTAASHLKIPSNLRRNTSELKKAIMDRALFFGIVDEDQYEDYLDGKSDFNKN